MGFGDNDVSEAEPFEVRYGDDDVDTDSVSVEDTGDDAFEDTVGSTEGFDAIAGFEVVGAVDAIDWVESVVGRPQGPPLRRRVTGSAMATTIAAAAAQR